MCPAVRYFQNLPASHVAIAGGKTGHSCAVITQMINVCMVCVGCSCSQRNTRKTVLAVCFEPTR